MSNRSSPLLFSDSQPDMLLPYQVQHDLISFGPAGEEGKSVPRRGLMSDNHSGPSVLIPEVIQERPNHGTQTSPVLEANRFNTFRMCMVVVMKILLSIKLKRQSLISEYFLYNLTQLQKNHLRL